MLSSLDRPLGATAGGTAPRRRPGLHSIFERTLHDERRALVGWLCGMTALTVWLLALYPTVRDSPGMTSLAEDFPDALKEMFGITDYTTGPGYLRAEFFSLTAPLLLVVLGILWGSDAVAGEEERHTLDLLLANPMSRRRLVAEKLAGVVAAVAIVGGGTGIALAVGAPIVGLEVGLDRIAAGIASTVLLASVFAAAALALGAATGRRGAARGIVTAVAVAVYLVSSLSGLVSWLEPWRWLSPWYHALGVDPVGTGFDWLRLTALAALIVALGVIGADRFERRDLSR